MTLIPAACGAGTVMGLVGVVAGSRKRPASDLHRPSILRAVATTAVGPVAAAFVVGIVTRWPVAAVLSGGAVAAIGPLLHKTSKAQNSDRIESVAVWTELLRDMLSASSGLAQALIATAPVAPAAIQGQVGALANRIASGMPMTDALRHFADEIDDSSADMVVCALLLAATSRAQRLVELLSALADSIREEVAMRLRVEASRAASRSGVRSVVVFSLVFAAALMIVGRSYLAPFGTVDGQLMLVVVGGFYAAGIYLMVRMVRPPASTRLLRSGSGH